MRNRILSKSIRFIDLTQTSSYYFLIFLCLILILSCDQGQFQPEPTAKKPKEIPTVDSDNLPPPIKAKYLDPESLSPPTVVPLKYPPTVEPAHPNVHPIGKPKVVQVPEDIEVQIFGDDIPMPESIVSKSTETPLLHSKPIPALASRMKDAAVFNIQHITLDEGLPFGGLSLMQDSKGNIWAGSGGGVVRYDGENFFPFTEQEGIFGGFVIFEDSKGRIWFGAPWNGFAYYNGEKVIDFRALEDVKNAWGNAVAEDSKGHIWWGTDKGVFRFDGEEFQFFKKENGIVNEALQKDGHFFDNRVNAIMEDSRGNIWWATSGSGVLRYDGNRLIRYTEREGLVDNYIKCIFEDSQGQIWFGSGGEGVAKGKGVSVFVPDRESNESYKGTFTNYSSEEGLSGDRITAIQEDKNRNIWISTFDGGLTCFTGKNFIHYTSDEGLGNNSINSMIVDREDNIWLGLNNNNGLHRIKINSFRHFTENQGLNNWSGRIAEDRKGNIWFGGCYTGLTKYDGQTFTNYSSKEEVIRDCPTPIFEDNQGDFWIGTRDEGIAQFDGVSFKRFGKEQGFTNPFYFSPPTLQDRQGKIWFSSFSNQNDGMAIRYDPVSGAVTHFTDGKKESIGGVSIFEDNERNIWLSGRGCIAKYDPQNDQINYVLQLDIDDPNWIHLLMDDGKGNLWFTIENDVRMYKMNMEDKDEPVFAYSKEHGMPDLPVKSVLVDDKDNIWVSGSSKIMLLPNGLSQMDSPTKNWIEYTKGDGLIGTSYDEFSTIQDTRNRLWVGSGSVGVAMLDLNTFEVPEAAPINLGLSHLDMQQHFIDYGQLSVDAYYSNEFRFGKQLSSSFDSISSFNNYPVGLSLPYNLNHLTFHFSAKDWSAPHLVRYSYKMDGIDDDWSPSDVESKADYRNLPHGQHTFHVKAIGESNVWSEPFSYSFTIKPPWWLTWWAYTLYFIVAVSAIGGYILRLRQKLQEEQEKLEREQYLNRELKELNIATTRFVPHDFIHILNKESIKELNLGDQTEATMTVLFADIRDYTSLSETMSPEDNFKFINAYLVRIGPIIREHGGFICQYSGDGIMALFKDNHDMAVKAAVEMQQTIQRYNRKRHAHNRKPIRVGIGLNTGRLMLGVIGDEMRYDTSVISDAVNTAARMEGLTKLFGCQVIVSEKTLKTLQLNTDGSKPETLGGDYRFLGKVKVKGKEHVLKIYDFYDGETEEIRQLKSSTKSLFEKALDHYYSQEFGKAADLFKLILEKYPSDVVTNYYMDKSVKYILHGVEDNWNGVEEMMSK